MISRNLICFDLLIYWTWDLKDSMNFFGQKFPQKVWNPSFFHHYFGSYYVIDIQIFSRDHWYAHLLVQMLSGKYVEIQCQAIFSALTLKFACVLPVFSCQDTFIPFVSCSCIPTELYHPTALAAFTYHQYRLDLI